MSIVSLIIKREFLSKVRNKSFIVMTFLSPLLFVGIAAFVGYLSSMKADTKQIAIHDETGLFVSEFKSSDEYKYVDLSTVDLKILKDSLVSEYYEGLIFIPKITDNKVLENKIQYISNDSPSMSFIGDVEDVIAKKITQQNFQNASLDTLAIKNAQANVNIDLKKSSGEESLKGLNEIKIMIGGAFGSSVKPYQLMMGKIIGTSLAGILQFLIWAIIGFLLMFAASAFFGVEMGPTTSIPPEVMQAAQNEIASTAQMYFNELWNLPLGTLIISFIVYFIGGYFLYSSFYAAIGSAVDNETDSQQFLLPIIMPLILGVYIGFFTVINDPHGTIATVFSMIPLTSPIVMLMRIPFGVPWWQILISVTILFATFFLVVWFAAKIYRVGILMYGKKPTWKELYKWLKY